MAFGRINVVEIRKIVAQNKAIDDKSVELVEAKFELAKEKMLEEFDNSDVTIEIKSDADGDNITGTLSDAEVPGNLFAFLGFENGTGDEIIEELRDLIDRKTYINTTKVKFTSDNIIRYRFTGKVPTEEEIKEATPVHWGDTARGRSWVAIVENGTNSFSYYLYKRWENGRSLEALQAKTKNGQLIVVNQGEFNPTPYTTKIIKEFVNSVGTTRL